MITIIIPTVGRCTLKRTLLSIRPYEVPLEVLVIGDGKQPFAKSLCKSLKVPYSLRYIKAPQTNHYGNEQRNMGISQARGDYLMFIDDDDIYVPDAFRHVDKAIEDHPDKPIIFKMLDHHGDRYILWAKRGNIGGNIGTPMICFPNNSGKLGKWPETNEYAGDAHFIHTTLNKWSKKDIVWADDCIVICRPEV